MRPSDYAQKKLVEGTEVKRHRTIAASPRRSASQAWATICDLVADTLERSDSISRSEIDATMARAGQVGLILLAGGHLETDPITVVAGALHLEILTVSGDEALTADENLSPVPGAAQASDWMVHLPASEPLTQTVEQICSGDEHLSPDLPDSSEGASSPRESVLVDSEALTAWAKDGR